MIYFIADTHFGHEKMLEYEPIRKSMFQTVEEMDEYIIKQYNNIVNKNDHVYFLGDISFYDKERTKKIIEKLKGNKILIIGNHDMSRSPKFWMEVGFKWASKNPIIFENEVILSHQPLNLGIMNIHGHLHSKPTNSELHCCVSVEQTGFKPVSWAWLERTLKSLKGKYVCTKKYYTFQKEEQNENSTYW